MGLFVGFQASESKLKVCSVGLILKIHWYQVECINLYCPLLFWFEVRGPALYCAINSGFPVLACSLAVSMLIKRIDKYGWVS